MSKKNLIIVDGLVGEVVKETESGRCYIVRIHQYPQNVEKIENDLTVVRKERVQPYRSTVAS